MASVHLKFREEITWRVDEKVLENHACHREGKQAFVVFSDVRGRRQQINLMRPRFKANMSFWFFVQ